MTLTRSHTNEGSPAPENPCTIELAAAYTRQSGLEISLIAHRGDSTSPITFVELVCGGETLTVNGDWDTDTAHPMRTVLEAVEALLNKAEEIPGSSRTSMRGQALKALIQDFISVSSHLCLKDEKSERAGIKCSNYAVHTNAFKNSSNAAAVLRFKATLIDVMHQPTDDLSLVIAAESVIYPGRVLVLSASEEASYATCLDSNVPLEHDWAKVCSKSCDCSNIVSLLEPLADDLKSSSTTWAAPGEDWKRYVDEVIPTLYREAMRALNEISGVGLDLGTVYLPGER